MGKRKVRRNCTVTWGARGRAALVESRAYVAVITDFGHRIKLDAKVAERVFSLDLAEYAWADWIEDDITGDYASYEEAIKDYDEIVAEWRGSGITIHDLDRWKELEDIFLGDGYYLLPSKDI